MATTAYSGKDGNITLPSTGTLATKSWSGDHEIDAPVITNKTSGGYEEIITGVQRFSGSADCVYTGTKPSLGDSGAFTLNFADSTTISGTCYVTHVSYESSVDGSLNMKLDFKATGTFSIA